MSWHTAVHSRYEEPTLWIRHDEYRVREASKGKYVVVNTDGSTWKSSTGRTRVWGSPSTAQAAVDKSVPYNKMPKKAREEVRELLGAIDLREVSVYPGQALVSAIGILVHYDSVDDANLPCRYSDGRKPGWCVAESNGALPGSGGVASHAVDILKAVKISRDFEGSVKALNDSWVRLAGHQSSYKDKVPAGLAATKPHEEAFVQALTIWMDHQ